MFINLIVPTNKQTKNTIKPQKKTREIMNLRKAKRKYKQETKDKTLKNGKQIKIERIYGSCKSYLPYEM